MKNRWIKLYFASGIYTSGLPPTTNYKHVNLLFTYITPTQNDPAVGDPKCP